MSDEERRLMELVSQYEEALSKAEQCLETAGEVLAERERQILEARDLVRNVVGCFEQIRESLSYGKSREALSICQAILGLNS